MNQLAHIDPGFFAPDRYFGPGVLLGRDSATGDVHVRFAERGTSHDVWARIAAAGADMVEAGDEVLIAGEPAGQMFVIGVLSRRHAASGKEIRTAGGAAARVETHESSERLRVFSERNELLFEYDPESGTGKLSMQRGDLEFETRAGDIRFRSAGDVRVEGREINLSARTDLQLEVVDAVRKSTSSLSLGLHRLKAAAAHMSFDAGRASVNVEETRYVGKRLVSRIAYAQLVADKCETVTRVLVEKSANAYRTVEQLSQLKAGRLRTLIAETWQLNSGRAFLKSRQDFKVKADKIHLG